MSQNSRNYVHEKSKRVNQIQRIFQSIFHQLHHHRSIILFVEFSFWKVYIILFHNNFRIKTILLSFIQRTKILFEFHNLCENISRSRSTNLYFINSFLENFFQLIRIFDIKSDILIVFTCHILSRVTDGSGFE